MNIDLSRLLNSYIEEITFGDSIVFGSEYIDNTDIRVLNDVYFDGKVSKTMEDMYYLNINVKGVMILPCSISLVDVEYPFNIEINEILTENNEDDEEYIKINQNTIDILPIIWQNIVMEIPLKVVSPNVDRNNYVGNGWKLVTEEDIKEER